MEQGWFRTHDDGKPETLARYFGPDVDDPYGAREIINGDKSKVPSWSGGIPIGKLIEGYHDSFLEALTLASEAGTEPTMVEMRQVFVVTVVGFGPFSVTIEPVTEGPDR
jgi:hypothetical protein